MRTGARRAHLAGDAIPAPGTPAPVTGRVLRDGQPVEGATITSGGALTYTLTGPDGRYQLDNVPAGASWVKASQVRAPIGPSARSPGRDWDAPDLHWT